MRSEERIAALEERVTDLERRLKRYERAARTLALREAGVAPAVCEMLMALYQANGRPLASGFLNSVIPRPQDGKYPEIVRVYVSQARARFGREVIVWRPQEGYRMPPEGRELLEAAWA